MTGNINKDSFEQGKIFTKEQVNIFIKNLAEIDDDILELYTDIFDSFICVKINLSGLDYTRINRDEEMDLIEEYALDIINMPPIVTSPSFDGKRIVYDGCHRCVALENLGIKQVMTLIPYKTKDGRLVEDIEINNPDMNKCKYGECDRGKCCLCCEHSNDCAGICNKCFEVGTLYKIIEKNVSLFCDGVW